MFSAKVVAILKHLPCLLLSFCMKYISQTKALCHTVLAAQCNVFFIKFLFLISLTCFIISYFQIFEDELCIFKDWLYVTYFSSFHTYLSLEKSIFSELKHRLDECLVSVSKARVMLSNSFWCSAIEYDLILVFSHLSSCKSEPWHHHSLCPPLNKSWVVTGEGTKSDIYWAPTMYASGALQIVM